MNRILQLTAVIAGALLCTGAGYAMPLAETSTEACGAVGVEHPAQGTSSEPRQSKTGKMVILKLDDVVSGTNGAVVSVRWQRVSDFLEGKKIKAAFGVIGYSLVNDNPDYFRWITDRAAGGLVEFWNHGFRNRSKDDPKGEFELGYDEQLLALRLTDSLARAKLGLELSTWGPHYSGTNEDTDKALARMPVIRMTFGYPPQAVHYKGIVIPHNIDLEYPTHNPDFEAFRAAYEGKWRDLDVFYLQGHPNSWDDARWENFVKVVEFLESEGVRFVTPAEYFELLQKK